MNILNQEKSILVSESDTGSVRVSFDVIKFIILQVALNTPGVAEKEVNFITRFLNKKTGSAVIQDYDNQELVVDVSIKVYYGTNIPAVCHEVQKLISYNLCQILDLKKVIVNISVDSLIVDKETEPKQTVK
jgi:uncharacterized alkaline shock family protein YloU